MKSLWPDDIGEATFEAPVTILKEQAKYLGEKTNNIVVAEVHSIDQRTYPPSIAFGFFIEAPALSDYTFRLFSITHGPDPYPLSFHLDEDIISETGLEPLGNTPTVRAEDKDEFVHILGKVLQAEKTQRIISALLAQSTAYRESTQPTSADRGNDNDNDIPF